MEKEYSRKHILNMRNSKGEKVRIFGLNKRPYPNFCELCGKPQQKGLQYHHWDKNNPNLGIWVCCGCHRFCERVDKGMVETYQKLISRVHAVYKG